MLSIGIVWNPAIEYFDDIVLDIQKRTTVYAICKETVLYKDSLVYEVYKDLLALDRSKLEFKLKNLFLSDTNEILVIVFGFDSSKVNYHPFKRKEVFTELDALKQEIRQKYGRKITNYQFDNVFHCTDDEEEFEYTYYILKKYFNDIPSVSSLRAEF